MAPLVTVVVPTHTNGLTLLASVPSALAQTHSELEVLIVGDGISEEGRRAARELEEGDPRVRLLDFPKGARLGEENRAAALDAATGEAVFYLSDDDLWLPHHVESLLELLDGADFAGATVVAVDLYGGMRLLPHDLADERWRKVFVRGHNRLPLSGGAHTKAAYGELAPGWRPSPEDVAADLNFFRGFLRNPRCAAASCPRPSALKFAAEARASMTGSERLAELWGWLERIWDPQALRDLEDEMSDLWRALALDRDLRLRRRRVRRMRGATG